jgi:hypothetical protein
LLGELVIANNVKIFPGLNEITLNIEPLQPSVYYMFIEDGKQKEVKKIIINE